MYVGYWYGTGAHAFGQWVEQPGAHGDVIAVDCNSGIWSETGDHA